MPDSNGYLSMKEAATLLPGPPTTSALCRWANEGARIGSERVKLQTVRVSNSVYTRWEWVQKWMADCDAARAMAREAARERRRPKRKRIMSHAESMKFFKSRMPR